MVRIFGFTISLLLVYFCSFMVTTVDSLPPWAKIPTCAILIFLALFSFVLSLFFIFASDEEINGRE